MCVTIDINIDKFKKVSSLCELKIVEISTYKILAIYRIYFSILLRISVLDLEMQNKR